MAARSRPRNGAIKDDRDIAHEERSLWESIIRDLEKVGEINAKAKATSLSIIDREEKMGKDPDPSAREIGELEELYRANVRHCEEEIKLLQEEPSEILKNLGLLQALRTASEAEPPRVVIPKVRKPKVVAPKVEMDTGADSPYPSPGPLSSASRLKGSAARSGSVASTRDGKETKEPVVKIEEGAEGVKGPSTERTGRLTLAIGDEVAYKQAKMKDDGSQWIQCTITSIIESKGKRLYEVQDPEPDETGALGQVYRAAASTLIAIPKADAARPEHSVGKLVLARYPETTTFYKAEVTKIAKDACKLKFEDDQNQELEVDRRYVLDFNQK